MTTTTSVRHEDRAVAKGWEQFWVHRLLDVEESLTFRWRDVLGFDVVCGEVTAALGERLVHHETEERLEWLREHVLRLAAQVSEWDEDFSLPRDTGTHALLRESIDWDALRSPPQDKHAREWMHPQQQAELEAWEHEQAESLRNQS